MQFKEFNRKSKPSYLLPVSEYLREVGNLDNVSVSAPDSKLPQEVFLNGFVARNPDNPQDEWYISKEYFDANFETKVPNRFPEDKNAPFIPKSLHNTTANGAIKNVKDIVFWGDGDTFKLICKASSEGEGWMKSTKAMEVEGVGCVVQITTQQRNIDGTYSIAEAVTFVPNCKIEVIKDEEGKITQRKLTQI